MKRSYTSLALALLAAQLMAQPIIPSGNSSFQPGESFLYHHGPYVTPPINGVANATWDFSTFSGSTQLTGSYVQPTGNAPTGTTVSEVAGTDAYAHYKATPTTFEQIGLTSSQATLTCQNTIMIMSYPMEFNTMVNDTYSCTGSVLGQSFTREGTMEITGASWGTLILPYGTINNVLMVYLEQHHQDQMGGDGTEYNAFTQWFIKPGVRAPLFAIYEAYQVPGQLYMYSRMLDELSTGVAEAMRNDIGIELVPNPATTNVDILFSATGLELTIELFDATGRIVRTTVIPAAAQGVERRSFDISGLSAGAYNLRMTDAEGAFGSKRLIVN